MLCATIYDLDGTKEVIAFNRPEFNREKKEKKDQPEWLKEDRSVQYAENNVRRAKTKVRRTIDRYKMKYMWTLTFATKYVQVKNPTNNKVTVYDAGNYDDAWKLWKLFLQRCKKAGLEFPYVVTIEVQEERLAKYGEKVYHFHFATSTPIGYRRKEAIKVWKAGLAPNANHWITKYWTFGFGSVTTPKKPATYLVKYIVKAMEEVGVGRQRYRIAEGLIIPVEGMKNITWDALRDTLESIGIILVHKELEVDEATIHWYLVKENQR